MSGRISLITILLVCCNDETARATVNWTTRTCQISLPETTPKESLHTFTPAPAGTNAYSIQSQNVTGRFAIASTGVLSSMTKLDYDSGEKSYSLQITAFNTDPKLNKSLTCVIQVTDVNDEHPQFVPESYSVDTVNNVAINTTVLTVAATDRDVAKTFSKVVYSIKDGENGVNFTINVDTGVISAKQILAAAVPRNLTLTVVATDNDKDAFTDDASVRVCVGCKTGGSSAPEITLFASMALVISVVLM